MPNERHSTDSARRRKSNSGNSQVSHDGNGPLTELPNLPGLTIQYNPPVFLSRHHLYPRSVLIQILGISDHTLRDWIALGLRPLPDSGKRQFFCGEELVAFMKSLRDGHITPPQPKHKKGKSQ